MSTSQIILTVVNCVASLAVVASTTFMGIAFCAMSFALTELKPSFSGVADDFHSVSEQVPSALESITGVRKSIDEATKAAKEFSIWRGQEEKRR
ncbi:hypothetical protein SH668x_001253 [Planctomicrobium sp. SH668]|uniref:hypothetical protein n=1 Tax=Planctomicrobium sp. SH668 TaxID=3448126 RepID=UPI003F5C8C25